MKVIAHRAGNSVDVLHRAERSVGIVEVDVHLGRRRRVEVRHAKRLWPSHRLWDRWFVLNRDAPVPLLGDILRSADPGTVFWLDLKGFTPRLTRRAAEVIGDRRPLVVSTKSWWILRAFAGLDQVQTIRSAGNRLELALLLWWPSRADIDGSVVHARLLSEATIRTLQRRGPLYTWAVHDQESIKRFSKLEITGVILDDLKLVESATGG